MILSPPIQLDAWIADNRGLLQPPVGNRALALGSELMVQVVGGPNVRTDFHVTPHEEWFLQLTGSMHLDVIVDATRQSVEIAAGQAWLLPGGIPHSPQRPDRDSVGLVVETVREPDAIERFRWYCQTCDSMVYETQVRIADAPNLPSLFAAFYANEDQRRCSDCGALHPGDRLHVSQKGRCST